MTDPSTDDGVLVVASGDVATLTGPDGVFLSVSPACRRLFGWEPTQLEGKAEADFVHPDDRSALRVGRSALVDDDAQTTTYRFLCSDGSYRWTETVSRRAGSDGSGLVVSAIRDISRRRAHTADLERLAFTDPLTGVANRPVLMDRLHQGLRRLRRSGGVLAVLYLDMDRFKVVNDSLGHLVGDAVLAQMAERLAHHLRPVDTLARLGGDEFAIVAEGLADEVEAIGLGERIAGAGRQPFRIGAETFECTISVGIACTADSERSADDLLSEADLALYRAKERGRNRAEAFDEQLRTAAVGRLVTERILRRSLDNAGLVVEYQPIIDLQSGRAVGAEALVRISDPERGLLLPESFLDVAAETGLLIGMDMQVMTDAVEQVSRWRSRLAGRSPDHVAINITARHLADSSFPRVVIDQLDTVGVPHSALHIEITERILLEASNSAITGLRTLRDAGVQVGLDDFGTGYSSLAYLRQFPLDFVEIGPMQVA